MDLLLCRAGYKLIAAVAGNVCLVVCWMDTFFHASHLTNPIIYHILAAVRHASSIKQLVQYITEHALMQALIFLILEEPHLFRGVDKFTVGSGLGEQIQNPLHGFFRLRAVGGLAEHIHALFFFRVQEEMIVSGARLEDIDRKSVV